MSHKERFQKSDLVRGYNEVIDSVQMQTAFDAAMLQFQSVFQPASDMGTAAANEWRRQGARQFLNILQGLNTNITQEKRTNDGELDYKA